MEKKTGIDAYSSPVMYSLCLPLPVSRIEAQFPVFLCPLTMRPVLFKLLSAVNFILLLLAASANPQ